MHLGGNRRWVPLISFFFLRLICLTVTVLYPIQQPGPEQVVSDFEVYELSTREVINISKAFSDNIQCVKRVRYSIRDLYD